MELPLLFDFDPFNCWHMGPLIAVLAVISLIADNLRVGKEVRRARALAAMATQHQLVFLGDKLRPTPELPAFRRGVRQYTVNTMEWSRSGRPVQLGDLQYQKERVDRDGDTHITNSFFSYAFVALPEARFAELLIRPELTVDKVAAAAGFEDINFESHQFSKMYFVQSTNRRFAYDVIAPQMMEYLIAHPGYTVHLSPAGLVVTIGGETRWKPEQFVPAAEFAAGFLERIPAHVWDTHKE